MKRFRVEHKYSGCQRVIIGKDFYDACRRCGCDPQFWKKLRFLIKRIAGDRIFSALDAVRLK